MEKDKQILSEITTFGKYSRYLPEEGRRETWGELITRNMDMHIKKYPELEKNIRDVYERTVQPKKALPSMRSLQFGGVPIDRSNSRIYNCAYLPIEDTDAFSEIMFLLLGGTGVGYSVQRQHVNKLPPIQGTTEETRKFLIGDSIEGWSDAVKVLVEAHFLGKSEPIFDYSDIREKGADLITSGGKAPGPEPLRLCLEKVASLMRKNRGNNLTPLGAHDIACHLADAVLAGGIRRAAMISLFSHDDNDMLTCKSGDWWETHPERGRANNSVTLLRGEIDEDQFKEIWAKVQRSGSGEPGIYWTNNLDWGTNP